MTTRKRVVDAARRIGYRPNEVARALFTGRTNRIGLYMGHLMFYADLPFAGAVLKGVLQGAQKHEMDVVIHTYGPRDRSLELATNRALDGIILHVTPSDPAIAVLDELRVPAVAIVDRVERLPSVTVDDRAGGAMLAEHLFRLGHRHVLVMVGGAAPTVTVGERVDGFCEVAQELGMRVSLDQEEFDLDPRLGHRQIKVLTELKDPTA